MNHYIRNFTINLHGFPSLVVSLYMHMIEIDTLKKNDTLKTCLQFQNENQGIKTNVYA